MRALSGRALGLIALVLIFFVLLPFYRWLGVDVCPLHRWAGVPCPTCGVTRATVALLNGNFKEAFVTNPLWVVFSLGMMMFLLFGSVRRRVIRCAKRLPRGILPSLLLLALLLNWIYLICRGV